MDKLTDQEIKFAEENHNLVYSFLRDKGLSYDDYYDVIIFGYIKAVKNYIAREDLRQYAFSTVAYKTMEGTLLMHYRMLSASKRSADVISIDSNNKDAGGNFFESLYGKVDDDFDDTLFHLELMSLMTSIQKKIAKGLSFGFSKKEIAVKTETSQKQINKEMKDMGRLLAWYHDRKPRIAHFFKPMTPLAIGERGVFNIENKIMKVSPFRYISNNGICVRAETVNAFYTLIDVRGSNKNLHAIKCRKITEPVTERCASFTTENGNKLETTSVCNIFYAEKHRAIFETENAIYDLSLTK